jgi:hypothetical protein
VIVLNSQKRAVSSPAFAFHAPTVISIIGTEQLRNITLVTSILTFAQGVVYGPLGCQAFYPLAGGPCGS